MNGILWNGQSAMNANQIRLDAISNNIANMATVGYKRVDVSFKDSFKESLERAGTPVTENGGYTGTGVIAGGLSKEFYQGVLMETGLSTDIGLEGRGMFKVISTGGQVAYTKAGSFMVDVNGEIVNSEGDFLEVDYNQEFLNMKENGEISLRGGSFTVAKDGIITVKNGEEFMEVGKIPLYAAEGSDPYISIGANKFLPREGSVMDVVDDTVMHQGLLEASNVDIGTEFSEMIVTQRAFQLGSKSIQTADEMWGMVNNLRGR